VYKVNNYQGDLAERINPRKQIKTIANVRRSCDYLTYQGSFKNVMVPSTKDILPRFGQTFKAGMSHGMPAFVGTSSFSARYFAIAGLYLPGLLQHHSIYLSGGYSREISSGSFRASNPVTIARGFKIRDTQFLSKILSVSANYTFPVLNPDIKWGSLAYFKRIYANLFLDYSTTSGRDYNSFGIEANIETHFFNLPVPVILQQRISIINNKAVNEYGIATRM
jgi:hypothetical protein